MDEEAFRFWTLIAQWLTAIGTVGAVVTALYLALRDEQVRLKVTANIKRGIVLAPTPIPDDESTIEIKVTNVGRRAVVMTGINWRFGVINKRYGSQLAHENPYSDSLPQKLEEGEYASFYITESKFKKNEEIISDFLPSRWVTWIPWWVRIGAQTSTGKTVWGPVAKSLRNWLLSEFADTTTDEG